MANLFIKEENLHSSPAIVGYRIMQLLEKKQLEKISIFDVADSLKDEDWFSPRTLYFAMLFLYSAGLINFNEPYIEKNVSN